MPVGSIVAGGSSQTQGSGLVTAASQGTEEGDKPTEGTETSNAAKAKKAVNISVNATQVAISKTAELAQSAGSASGSSVSSNDSSDMGFN